MKCPNCNETLVMADRQGIEIDYCPACRGVWLDKGELDKIIERSADWEQKPSIPPTQNTYKGGPQYGDHHPDSYYNKHKKKKGFLGEFFDFD